jgi:hypothetical protein
MPFAPVLLAAFHEATFPAKTRLITRLKPGEFLDSLISRLSVLPDRWTSIGPDRTRQVMMRSRGGMTEPTHVPAPPAPASFDLSYPISVVDRLIEISQGTVPPTAAAQTLGIFLDPIAPERTRRVRIRTTGGEWTPWFAIVPPPSSAIVLQGNAYFGLDLCAGEEILLGLELLGDAYFDLDLCPDEEADFGT